MAKIFKEKDLFDGSLFGTQIEEAKVLIGVFDDLKKSMKDYGKIAEKNIIAINELTSEGVEEINNEKEELIKNTETLNKATAEEIKLSKQLLKLQQEEAKLKDKLNEGTSEQAKANEKIKIQIAEQNKLRKEQAKESLGLISIYAKESKRLRNLKNNYKDLVLAGKENEKATKDMKNEIKKLDQELKDLDAQVGDNFRNVGSYTDALKKTEEALENLDKTAKRIGITAIFLKLVELGGQFFGESREASKESAKGFAELTERVKVFISSSITAFFGLKDVIVATWVLIGIRFDKIADGIAEKFLELKIIFQKGLAFFDEGEKERLLELQAELKELEEKTYDLDAANKQLTKGIEAVSSAFEDDVKQGNEAVKIKLALIDATGRLEIENLKLQRSLVGLLKVQEEAAIVSEDDTIGFDQRIAASERWIKANTEVANLQEQIAFNNLELQRLTIGSDLVIAGILSESEAREISAANLNKLLLQEGVALKVSSANEQAYTDSFIEFQEAKTNSSIVALDSEQKIRKLKSDELEKDLDILIDGADNQKTINEIIIADQTKSQKARQKILDDTVTLIEVSFEKQKQAIIDFGVFQTETNSKLSAKEKKIQLDKIKNADIDDLVRTKSAEELQEKIRGLGLAEIFEGRLLEVIRERRIATQDLSDTQKELNTDQRETNEILADIVLQEEALERLANAGTSEELAKVEAQLAKERQEARLKAIEIELATVEKGSRREAELNQEKNDILLDQNREALDQRTEAAEKEAEALEEIYSNVFSFLSNASDEYYSKQLDQINENLQASKDAEAQLIKAAEKGVNFAKESIAFERKNQAELEAERIKTGESKARAELFITGLEQLQANEGNVGKTFSDLFAIREFVKAFPLFYEGTENTGAGGNLDNKGGFGAVLHPYERVISASDNSRIGDISNEDLTSLAEMHHAGYLAPTITTNQDYSDQFDQLNQTLKKLPEAFPDYGLKYDPIKQVLIETIKRKGSKETRIHKTNYLLD